MANERRPPLALLAHRLFHDTKILSAIEAQSGVFRDIEKGKFEVATHPQRGQSLVELLLASFLLVSFLLGFAALANTAIQSQKIFRFEKSRAGVPRAFRFH